MTHVYDDPEDTQECYQRNGELTTHRDPKEHVESWNHANQAYVVNGWKWTGEQEPIVPTMDNDIACFFRGRRSRNRRPILETDEEDSEDEDTQLGKRYKAGPRMCDPSTWYEPRP